MAQFQRDIGSYRIISDPFLIRSASWFFLALETVLGAMLVSGYLLRGWTIHATSALILFFTGTVIYADATVGLENCGCMGAVKMTPEMTIGKNILYLAMGVVGFIAYRRAEEITGWLQPWKLTPAPATVIAGVSILLMGATLAAGKTFLESDIDRFEDLGSVAAVSTDAPTEQIETPTAAETPEPAPSVAGSDTEFGKYKVRMADGSVQSLASGDFLVALLSMTCEHCKESVPELMELEANLAGLVPVVSLAMGNQDSKSEFVMETGANFPITIIEDLEFFQRLGDAPAPPRFLFVRGGEPIKSWNDEPPAFDDLLNYL